MNADRHAHDVAIIGAGVAGASAARALADRGLRVVVYDKGRVPGGRAATRQRGSVQFDHGAQYFTAREPEFLSQVRAWQLDGLVAEWRARFVALEADGRHPVSVDEPRWVAVPGMRMLASTMLAGIDVHCSSRVMRVERAADCWWVHLDDGSRAGPFADLISTVPAPQAAQLLADEPVAPALRGVDFAPCWALMLEFDGALDLDFDGAFVNVGPLSWLARDSSKPGRPTGERWIVHADAEFSRAQLESNVDDLGAQLLCAFFQAIDRPLRQPTQWMAHRWRYALAQPPLHCGAIADPARRIAVGGDWCSGSRIEGAWRSGRALAACVASALDSGSSRPATVVGADSQMPS